MIEGRVLKLDGLIKKIIDYYKNARSEEVLDSIEFESLFNSVWDILRNQMNTIDFKLNVKQDSVFKGDFYRLEVVFENLISNAIKYQIPENQHKLISVNAHIDEKYARIAITDNGIGIKPEYIENIFNLFFRADDSLNTEGTGIGLYIVKEAIEKMKGEISVKSTPMSGTTFEVIIPNR